jgi:DNA-binding LytR/AlgR family response regulator
MKRLSNQLPGTLFIQIHRNFMINTTLMENINPSRSNLKVLGKTIPIGLRFRRALLKRLKI